MRTEVEEGEIERRRSEERMKRDRERAERRSEGGESGEKKRTGQPEILKAWVNRMTWESARPCRRSPSPNISLTGL